MANGDTQDERAMDEPTPEELRAAEIAKTQQALALVNAQKDEESSLQSYWNKATANAPAALQNVAPSLPNQTAAILPPRNRMYMGPGLAVGPDMTRSPQEFFGADARNTMIMPPPPEPLTPDAQAALQSRIARATGGESDASALSRMQAAEGHVPSTIAVNSEPPYSDASLANQRNMMLYNAMKKFDAGDRSPEVQSLILGKAASSKTSAIPPLKNINGIGYTYNPNTGQWEARTPAKVNPIQPSIAERQENSRQWNRIEDIQKEMGIMDRNEALSFPVNKIQKSELTKELESLKASTDDYRKRYIPSPVATATGTTPTPVTPPAGATRPAATTSSDRIRVRNPQGKVGTIPASQLDDAIAKGWKKL
jgi:hypothetical protein